MSNSRRLRLLRGVAGDAQWRAEDAQWRAEDAQWRAEDAQWRAEDMGRLTPVSPRFKRVGVVLLDILRGGLAMCFTRMPDWKCLDLTAEPT